MLSQLFLFPTYISESNVVLIAKSKKCIARNQKLLHVIVIFTAYGQVLNFKTLTACDALSTREIFGSLSIVTNLGVDFGVCSKYSI